MTPRELDELLETKWPAVVRHTMADGSDEWLKGFVRSIARQAKRASWRPSAKQEQIMRRLVADMALTDQGTVEVIER